MKKCVIGNATIDGILDNGVSVQVREHNVILKHNAHTVDIAVKDGPIRAGGKYTAEVSFVNVLQAFPRTEQFGGGGYLSAAVLRSISNGEIDYVDISTPSLDTSIPGASLADKLQTMEINPYFMSARPIPFNIILGSRADKIILKSGLRSATFGKYHKLMLRACVNDADGIFFNSLKDHSLVELALHNYHKKIVGVITDSLDPEYVLQRILPFCICQFNYDEFGYIVNPDHKVIGDEQTRIESARDGIRRLREDYGLHNRIYVTLGKNGVLCSGNSETYHIRFEDDVLERIQEAIRVNPKSTTGAGDAHAASVFNDELAGLQVIDIAKRACITAVRYLGYNDPIHQSDFIESKQQHNLVSCGVR